MKAWIVITNHKMRIHEWDSFETASVKNPLFAFDFPFEAHLPPKLCFAEVPSAPPPRRYEKRMRPKADVDGEGSGDIQKKKRRLRLELITSRLSRPYATPTSHIVGRGSSRTALWARKIASGRHPLHKVAILNSLRLDGFSVRKWPGPKYMSPSQLHVEKVIEFRRNRTESPLSSEIVQPAPNPFKGLSNYDAIDREGDPYGDIEAFEDDRLEEVERHRVSRAVEEEDDEFSMYPEYGAMDDEMDAIED